MINVAKLYPDICKHDSCLKKALYEFTDDKEDEKGEYMTITIGYSCEHHVEEVNKLLKEIYYGNEKSDNIQ